MNKTRAINISVEIAKIAISSTELRIAPHKGTADDIADFIETLSARLEKIADQT
ncbi:MAG: hypothetical protein GXW99_05280 [Clostridiales bacterium]|nr:hypothetical protein [Clostridiales bacterium]